MPMRLIITLLIIIVTTLLVLAGCYTILKHPGVRDDYQAADYQRDCLSCHPDYQAYPYGYFYGHYPGYWWDVPRWGHYYAYPWWWDYYWYDGPVSHPPDDTPHLDGAAETSEGKATRRDALRPPYTEGNVIPNISRNQSPSSPSGQTGIGGVKPSTPENKPADDSQTKEKKKDDDRDGKKATRRGGREN